MNFETPQLPGEANAPFLPDEISRYLLQDSVDDAELAAEMAAVAMLYGFQLRVGEVRQLQIEDLVLDHDREQVIHLGGAAIMRGFGPIYQGFKHHWSSVFDGNGALFKIPGRRRARHQGWFRDLAAKVAKFNELDESKYSVHSFRAGAVIFLE